MKKAKIYIPAKTPMQSGRGKLKRWVLKFETKDKAVEYAIKNGIKYQIIEPKPREFVIKSYAENFTKN